MNHRFKIGAEVKCICYDCAQDPNPQKLYVVKTTSIDFYPNAYYCNLTPTAKSSSHIYFDYELVLYEP